jgi:signal transduction histidine kinase
MVDTLAREGEEGIVAPGGTDSGTAPSFRELLRWHGEMLRGVSTSRRLTRPGRRQQRLIESLNEVASAVSSSMSMTDVLTTVVDEAKNVIGTDKAVLCLLSDGKDGPVIDEGAVFVRGRRNQYPEEWWRARISDSVKPALEQRTPSVAMIDGTWLMTMPVKSKGRPIGVLAVMNPMSRRFTDDQVALAAVLGAFAGTAIDNARLHKQSQYALLADERNRIAKEMHDGLSQSLFGTSLEIDVCRKRMREHPAEVEKRLDHAQAVLIRSLSELRRYIHDLRPISLNTLGLVGAMHQRAIEIGEAYGLAIRVYAEGTERPLPPGAEACLYRVAQEAVANVAKHADAKHAFVMLHYGAADMRLTIEDDGHGFDINEALRRVSRDECIGLKSMRERVQSEGGRFSITSGSRGTSLEVVLPC